MSRVGDVIVDAGVLLEVLFDGRQSLLPPRDTKEAILPFRATPFRVGRTEVQREAHRRASRARRRRLRRES